MKDEIFQSMTRAFSKKKKIQSAHSALPLSYRRLVVTRPLACCYHIDMPNMDLAKNNFKVHTCMYSFLTNTLKLYFIYSLCCCKSFTPEFNFKCDSFSIILIYMYVQFSHKYTKTIFYLLTVLLQKFHP